MASTIRYLRKLRHRLRSINLVLGNRALPLSAKTHFLLIPLLNKIGTRESYVISLGFGTGVILARESLSFDRNVFREIFIEEVYYTDYTDAVILDIGAYKGYYAVYVLRKGASKVYCYEPESHNFMYLRKIAEFFKAVREGTEMQMCAIGSRNLEADFYVTDTPWSHSLLKRTDKLITRQDRIKILSINEVLDRAVQQSKGRRLIIKIDAEGAECDIVLGMEPEFLRRIDELFVEYHSFSPCKKQEIMSYLSDAGFYKIDSRFSDILHFERPLG